MKYMTLILTEKVASKMSDHLLERKPETVRIMIDGWVYEVKEIGNT